MAVDASGTRAKLIAAGEKIFATDGIHGAQMRDIVRTAGQSNDSAVHYHFGSRQGLLREICERHIAEMEPGRRRRLAAQGAEPELSTVVADLVAPTADRLQSQAGRYFLRITAQLAGHAGVRSGAVTSPVLGSALLEQLEQLQALCARTVSAELAGERIAIMIGALTAALADRAVGIDKGTDFSLDEAAFVDNLVAMLVAALEAPVPVAIR
jgi:TetR/AcrR family transcriptional regulator, regulator of cefoperazone and chloramphenicol sensitivity